MIPNNYAVSFVLLIGFSIVIIGFFLFINLNLDKDNFNLVQIRLPSENSIKVILMIAMTISLLIPPISTHETIIVWSKVESSHIIRAIIIIIGTAFLPGANLYSLFLSKSKLHEKFGIESFFLKISIYPLLSFSFLGVSVLMLDQFGLARKFFDLVLFILILNLLILDFIFQKVKKDFNSFKPQPINISMYTSIILIISLGITLVAIGIQIGMYYLIPGDSWIGLAPANYIGTSDGSPIDWGRIWSHYPIFWSYTSFGLSVLCGLPYFNTNVLLAPFSYLFITTSYIMMKTILYKLKESYACFSTILLSIFSTLFYISTDYGHGDAPGFIFDCEFIFYYKSFSYILLFISIAIFKIELEKLKEEGLSIKQAFIFKEVNLTILIGFFLVLCFMLYIIPLVMGLIIIMLIFLSYKDKKKSSKILLHTIFYFNLIFILFDIIMNFYLSESSFWVINWFFNIKLISQVIEYIPHYILMYSLLWSFFIIILIIQLTYNKYFFERKKEILSFNLNIKKIFKLFILIFIIFFVIEIISIILEDYFLKFKLDNKFIFFYYLDKVFLNIGCIGIIAGCLSYYSYKKNKKLFNFLILWIFFTFLLGSILILIYSIKAFSIMLISIDAQNIKSMDFWYNRIWIYSIIPLCILCAIGLKQFSDYINIHPRFNKIFNSLEKRKLLKFSSLSLLIFLTYSNLILAGIWTGNINNRPREEEIELLGWMSENIPEDSRILIDRDYIIRVGIFSMVNGRYYFINDYFKSDYNQTENIEEIEDLKEDEIEYLLIHEDYLYGSSNRSKFVRRYLIPFFYNDSKHKTNHYRLYQAPFFD